MKYILIILLFLPCMVFAQDFSKEDYIYLKRHEHIKIELKNNEFNIIQNVSKQAEFLTSNSLFYANEYIGYSSFSKIKDIEAYTFIPSTNKKIKVEYYETKQHFDNMVFYDDTEYTNFIFPAVAKGAITNLKYKRIIKEPHFIGGFNFAIGNTSTKSAQLSIEFPKNVTIGYTIFNTEDIDLNFKKEETKSNFIYTWTAKNVSGYKGEKDSEAALYYLPHIVLRIKNYEDNGEVHNVLNDVNDLHKWYTTFIDEIDDESLNEVFTITDEITKTIPNKIDKAKAIFNWVQDNINYIAFGDGYRGLIPSGAASVFNSRYGDCKAMSNLLYEMLNHAEIESYITWIGSRNRPYSYFEVPTAAVDDHMINTIIIENDTIFLDATDSFVPFGMPSAFIQSKEALISISKEDFKITKVPIQKTNESVSRINSAIRLENGTIKISEKRDLTGYEKVDFIDKYRAEIDDKTEEEFLNITLALGNNKTNYNNIKIENFDNKTTPLVLSYDLSIDNYAKTVANKTYINLNIDRVLAKSKIDIEDRKYSKKIDNKFKKNYTTTFTIPKGYKASHIPKDLYFDNPEYGYNITYTQKDNIIIQDKTIYINTLSVKNKDFQTWNDFIKSLTKAYKKSIIIEKTL
jgi:uncharacterized protein DUF3857/transglutaminase superfamily protein